MAIITRWRMPPESSCGYWRSRRSGSPILTAASAFKRQRARLARVPTRRWTRIASVSCRPTVSTGLSEVIGSWKIIATSAPRTSRISRSLRAARSRPARLIVPPAIRAIGCGQEPHDRERRHRLARAGLAGDAERLPGGDVEGQPVDDGAPAVVRRHLDDEVADGEDGGEPAYGTSGSSSPRTRDLSSPRKRGPSNHCRLQASLGIVYWVPASAGMTARWTCSHSAPHSSTRRGK